MPKLLNALLFISALTAARIACAGQPIVSGVAIVTGSDASAREVLAAREVMRYVYQRTGIIAPIVHQVPGGECIVIVTKGSGLIPAAAVDRKTLDDIAALKAEEYIVRTLPAQGPGRGAMVLVAGGDDTGALYGAYRFAEHLGVRFYLHGDTIPDEKIPWALPSIDETGRPLFATRGIQPFHDFPEGPDWWNRDDYLAYVAQLPKLRMNFIGLHTYPEKAPSAEPAVWIGLPQDVLSNGDVAFSYPASWASTLRQGWGYAPLKTADFCAGAAQLFDVDSFGAQVMGGMMPTPATPAQCNELFNRTGRMLHDVFAEAKELGVQTCIGTETPITIPGALREHMKSLGKNPADPAIGGELYKGMFRRISLACPVDYYWLWTPESWTWNGNSGSQYQTTVRDIHSALDALSSLGNPFKLATCGWVLGPAGDRSALDRELPTDVPMSAINQNVGHSPLDPAFSVIHDRPKWAIPWLENDPQLTQPQPWAGRMRYDAVDARRAGCTGLLGIHWRTKAMAVNIASLADAAWDQSWAPAQSRPVQQTTPTVDKNAVHSKPAPVPGKDRSMPVEDLYEDFARANFGASVAGAAGQIMAGVDGTKMPRAADWLQGPGGIVVSPLPWEKVSSRYRFVEQFAALRPQVKGKGNLARFDYWLNTYRYASAMNELGSTRGELDRLVKALEAEKDPVLKKQRAQDALSLRLRLTRLWEKMMTFQIAAADTPGELGTIANLEQHTRTWLHFLTADDANLSKALGTALPAEAALSTIYAGEPRIIVPTLREQAAPGERLMLKIILLGAQPAHWHDAALFYRPLGRGDYNRVPLQSLGREVFQATLPAASGNELATEYYIGAAYDDKQLVFPSTAPAINQSVVIAPPAPDGRSGGPRHID